MCVCVCVCVGGGGGREGGRECGVLSVSKSYGESVKPNCFSEPHYILQQNALVVLVKHISNRIVYDFCSLQITYQWVKSTLAMATALVPVEPNEEECSVCHEQFTEPKLLPCGHLMCLSLIHI